MSPLYRFLCPPAFPSLFFIGICKIICPFPNFDCQVSVSVRGGGSSESSSQTLLSSAGPVLSGRAGRVRNVADSGADGGRSPARAAGETGSRSPAAPPAEDGPGPVGVLPDAGALRRIPAAASGRSQPVRGGVATAAGSPPKLPEPQLPAGERHPVGAGVNNRKSSSFRGRRFYSRTVESRCG